MKKIYFDYAATTPTDPEVTRAMEPYYFEKFGNASSFHGFGQEAKKGVEDAREALASFLGARPEEIIFTCGGTESNNFVIQGVSAAMKEKGNHIITSAIEHHSVGEPCQHLEKKGFKVTYVGVDKYGVVSAQEIKQAITDKTILISVMHANNEIGSIQPIAQIGRIAREKGVYFHTDAVQTVGHIPTDVNELNVDFLSLSAHKFYGPKGVGALYVRKGSKIHPYLRGGGQERGRRASTLNSPGIVGLGKAIQICAKEMEKEAGFQSGLRDKIIFEVKKRIPEVYLNGHPTERLPNNVNFSVKYIEGESMLLRLDMQGIAASSGSACTSATLEPSHVLLATGLEHDLAHGSLRVTLGRWSCREEVDYFLECFPGIVDKLRRMSPLYEEK